MTGAVWLMLLCCILGLNFLGGAFQAWVGLHLYGRWGLEFLAMCRFWKIFWLHCNGMLSWLCVVMVLWIFQVWCMNTLELVLKSKRRLLAFFLDFSVGCSNTICRCPSGVFWKFGAWWLTIWLLMMWVFPPHPLFFFSFFFFFNESLVLSNDLVVSHSRFLCDFSDVFKFLGWIWGACKVWAGFGVEWPSGIVWIWAWKVLVSWWSGVAPSLIWVSSYNNSNSSLSLHPVGWLSNWWRDCSGPW